MAKQTTQSSPLSPSDNQNALIIILIVSVLLLSVSQYMLFRNIEQVKAMISVSVMELKEGKGVREDAVVYKDGKVAVWRAGQVTEVEDMLKLSNGTTVSKDGVIVHQDGVVQRMEDGEEVRLEDLQ
jgi:magnesium-transporting ATPase (P-type)